MQGRFSGRLALKEDEKRLAEECRLLGPLLGGVGKRTDKSRLTLAKIVRGIACGAVRKYCEEREGTLQVGAPLGVRLGERARRGRAARSGRPWCRCVRVSSTAQSRCEGGRCGGRGRRRRCLSERRTFRAARSRSGQQSGAPCVGVCVPCRLCGSA